MVVVVVVVVVMLVVVVVQVKVLYVRNLKSDVTEDQLLLLLL